MGESWARPSPLLFRVPAGALQGLRPSEPWRLRGAVTGVPGATGLPSLRSGAATGLFPGWQWAQEEGAAGLEKRLQHKRSRGQSRMVSLSGRRASRACADGCGGRSVCCASPTREPGTWLDKAGSPSAPPALLIPLV